MVWYEVVYCYQFRVLEYNTVKSLAVILVIVINTVVAASELPAYSLSYDPDRNPFIDYEHALNDARQSDRLVLLELGGDWCLWCHRLDSFYRKNTRIRDQLLEVFVVLKVNVSEQNWNEAFLSHLPAVNGYPHFFISDAEGHVIGSQDVFDLEDGGSYSRRQFSRFIKIWSEANIKIQSLVETGHPAEG